MFEGHRLHFTGIEVSLPISSPAADVIMVLLMLLRDPNTETREERKKSS